MTRNNIPAWCSTACKQAQYKTACLFRFESFLCVSLHMASIRCISVRRESEYQQLTPLAAINFNSQTCRLSDRFVAFLLSGLSDNAVLRWGSDLKLDTVPRNSRYHQRKKTKSNFISVWSLIMLSSLLREINIRYSKWCFLSKMWEGLNCVHNVQVLLRRKMNSLQFQTRMQNKTLGNIYLW
jgi:hypothetical protein